MKFLPVAAAGAGVAAVVAGVYGLCGLWWALVAAGVFLMAWAVLSVVGDDS